MIGINFEFNNSHWNWVQNDIHTMRTRISKKLKDMIEDTAQELINDITKHILMDDLGLKDLAPSTIKKKEKTAPAFANKPWVESRTFMDGLTFWWEGYGDKGKEKTVAIGVPQDLKRKGSNGREINVNEYMQINEIQRPLMQLSMNRFLESGKPEKFMDKYFGDND
jgi:hypothetical protein